MMQNVMAAMGVMYDFSVILVKKIHTRIHISF